IAAASVPRGGAIVVDVTGEGDALAMRVEARGANARLSHGAAEILSGAAGAEIIDARSIQPYFTALLARECHMRLQSSTAAQCVTLAAIPEAVGDTASTTVAHADESRG